MHISTLRFIYSCKVTMTSPIDHSQQFKGNTILMSIYKCLHMYVVLKSMDGH